MILEDGLVLDRHATNVAQHLEPLTTKLGFSSALAGDERWLLGC